MPANANAGLPGAKRSCTARSCSSLCMDLESGLGLPRSLPSLKRIDPKQWQAKPIFADSDELKKKVRASLTRKTRTFQVSDLYHEAGFLQAVARSQVFEYGTLAMIAANAVWIAVDADYNHSELILDADPIFQVMDNVFCAYFFLEWAVRFLSFRRKVDALKDRWFLFDSVLAFLMVLETWIMTLVMAITGVSSKGFCNASILRLLRLLRLSRMARVARLLRAVPELMILIKGLIAAMRSVVFAMGFLVMVIYVFGLAMAQLTSGTEAGEKYFKTVLRSMYSVALHATLLDGPSRVLEDTSRSSKAGAVVFFLAVVFSALTVINMLIGVICEVVSNVSAVEKETLRVQFVKEKVRQLLSESGLDENHDGLISKDELMALVDNEEAVELLDEAGVDVVGLLEFAEVIFQSDSRGRKYEKQLTFSDFMELVLQHRGTNAATVKDIVDLRKLVHCKTTAASNQMTRVEARLQALCPLDGFQACVDSHMVESRVNDAGKGGTCYSMARKEARADTKCVSFDNVAPVVSIGKARTLQTPNTSEQYSGELGVRMSELAMRHTVVQNELQALQGRLSAPQRDESCPPTEDAEDLWHCLLGLDERHTMLQKELHSLRARFSAVHFGDDVEQQDILQHGLAELPGQPDHRLASQSDDNALNELNGLHNNTNSEAASTAPESSCVSQPARCLT